MMLNRPNGARLCSVLILSVLCNLAHANNSVIRLAPDDKTFFEKYDQTVDVAGQLRAGLMYGSSLDTVNIDDLKMDLSLNPVKPDEIACLRVASRNGAFSATWKVTLKTGIDEQVVTDFPTKHRDILEKFKPDQLVAIASVVGPGQACNVLSRRYLPTSWGNPDRQVIVAYLNADSTNALIAGKTTGDPLKNPCKILPTTEQNIAFDTICSLELGDASNTSAPKYQIPTEIVVLRKNFSTVMKKISYPLLNK